MSTPEVYEYTITLDDGRESRVRLRKITEFQKLGRVMNLMADKNVSEASVLALRHAIVGIDDETVSYKDLPGADVLIQKYGFSPAHVFTLGGIALEVAMGKQADEREIKGTAKAVAV